MSVDSISHDQLRAFVERLETLEEEKKAVADNIKEVMAEAKATGFDTGAIRAILRLRKQDPDDLAEKEAILELYKSALGMS